MNATTNKLAWLNTNLYPFKSNYIQLQGGRMHYIDEGEGATILFVHGTPTWSFLYRDHVKQLSKNFRCIAIDHVGFGLSEKSETFDGDPQSHSKNLIEFIDRLDLNNITLIVHDFGGPIGLSAGIERSDKIQKVVMLNTWLWRTAKDPATLKIDKMINSRLGRFLYLNMNFSPKILLKKAFSEKKLLSKEVHHHYTSPFPTKKSRIGLYQIAQALVGASEWYEEQWQKLEVLEDKDWLILWGSKDPFISTQYLERWKKRLPNAKVQELDCGHFVQEEMQEESIQPLKMFLRN